MKLRNSISQQFTQKNKNERGYVYLSGDTDYIGGRYVGSSSGGTIGGGVGGAAGGPETLMEHHQECWINYGKIYK